MICEYTILGAQIGSHLSSFDRSSGSGVLQIAYSRLGSNLEVREIVSKRHSDVGTLTYISLSTGESAGVVGQATMNHLKQLFNGQGGIIVPNPEGHIEIAHNTPRMAWDYKTVHKEAGIGRSARYARENCKRHVFLRMAPSHGILSAPRERQGTSMTVVCGGPSCYSQPLVRAILAASTRLPAPSLLMASER